MPENGIDENSPVQPSVHESCAPLSNSSSTVSRLVGRLDDNLHRMSSLRTVPSCRSSLRPDARKKYASTKARYDCDGSSTHNQPHSRGVKLMSRRQHSSCGNLRYPPPCRRRQDKCTTSQHDLLHVAPSLSRLVRKYSQSTTMTNGSNDPNCGPSSSSNMFQSSFDIHVPFPSTSEESYPSAYSTDAIAVFQAPPDINGVHYFEGRWRHDDIFEDWVEIIAAVEVDETSTSAHATSVHTASRPRRFVDPLRRRARAFASFLLSARHKFPITFIKLKEHRPPHIDDYDHNSVEYDIPCLAYISCLW